MVNNNLILDESDYCPVEKGWGIALKWQILAGAGAGAGVLGFAEAAKYSALYVLGDSLVDPGNNNYFIDTLAKANFLPNGIDFSTGPSGRFCNGKVIADFIVYLYFEAEHLGFPIPPSYANTVVRGAGILSGVNYASAGAGILDDTGIHFVRLIPLGEQISNLKKTVAQLSLTQGMEEEEVRDYLSRALAFLDIGSNDYLNNYLLPDKYISSHLYTPQQFLDLLINRYRQYILEIQELGIRKFFIAPGYPVGCLPLSLIKGECNQETNKVMETFNSKLNSMVHGLMSDYPGSAFMTTDSFEVFFHVRDNAAAYGLKVLDRACCGSNGAGGTKPLCLITSIPCSNRSEYMFWDSAHPTEATNKIVAQLIYNTTSWL